LTIGARTDAAAAGRAELSDGGALPPAHALKRALTKTPSTNGILTGVNLALVFLPVIKPVSS
jgi:hypothetical protein